MVRHIRILLLSKGTFSEATLAGQRRPWWLSERPGAHTGQARAGDTLLFWSQRKMVITILIMIHDESHPATRTPLQIPFIPNWPTCVLVAKPGPLSPLPLDYHSRRKETTTPARPIAVGVGARGSGGHGSWRVCRGRWRY